MFGLLNVNKPSGPTSHDVVAGLRRMIGKSTKIGHCGTLDPFANGVLVVCLGPATRLAEYVSAWPKQYRAEITFGVTSTTDDPEGELTVTGRQPPEVSAITELLPSFLGDVDQVPPAHSAALVDGRRAYKLARAGREVALASKRIRIDSIELKSYQDGRAVLNVACGSGTYIRSLARDLGEAAGCGAYCSALTRTRIGRFTVEDALTLEHITLEHVTEHLQPPTLALAGWPVITLTAEQEARVRLGQNFATDQDLPPAANASAQTASGQLLAICTYEADFRRLQPTKVMLP